MIAFPVARASAVLHSLDVCRSGCQYEADKEGATSRISSDLASEFVSKVIPPLKELCHTAELEKSRSLVESLELSLCAARTPHLSSLLPLNTVAGSKMLDLHLAILDELRERQFAFIPKDKALLFEKEKLFGEAVEEKFPSAGQDIKDAGNCLAADLNTAAVFHLMRVAEFGLRALAKKLRVKLSRPLEYAEWGRVIQAIEKKLIVVSATPVRKKRAQDLEFYTNAISDLRVFKDTWRDCVMHTRGSYNASEAMRAYLRVSEFMERLAPHAAKL